MNTLSLRKKVTFSVALILSLVSSFSVFTNEVGANGRRLNQGYFFDQTLSSGYAVINNGLPEGRIGTDKEAFIAFIEERMNTSTRYGVCVDGRDTTGCDYAGSRYIIQTMRGPDAAGNWDQKYPDAANIADWKAKIRSPQIAMRWGFDGGLAGGLTTDRFKNGAERDVAMTSGATSGRTLMFYNTSNGANYYLLRQSCGNPLGNVSGLPNLPVDYNLDPSVTAGRTAGEPGETVDVTPLVNNNGSVTSNTAYWSIATMSFAPGVNPPTTSYDSMNYTAPAAATGAVDNTRTCKYFKAQGATDCAIEGGNDGFGQFSVGSPAAYSGVAGNPWSTKTHIIGDYTAGTKVCYSLSVYARNQVVGVNGVDQQWRYSAPICVVVAKKPKVQVQGGDLSVGNIFSGTVGALPKANIVTGVSEKNISGTQRRFGSWVEYGIFATGTVTGAASGSAYAGLGLDNPNSNTCRSSTLSFTNAGSSVCGSAVIGNYTNKRSIPDVAASFPGVGATIAAASLKADDLLAGDGVYIGTRTGDLTLSQSDLRPGKSIILKVSGNVTITGNQVYNPDNNGAKYTKASQLPQLVIIARNINIIDSVTQIDAWLIAKSGTLAADGTINTCSTVPVATPLTTALCDKQLVVNGPVMAQKLYLRRTAGSGTGAASSVSAEIFNLRPDAYLWAAMRATGNGRIQTVYTTELPPRL